MAGQPFPEHLKGNYIQDLLKGCFVAGRLVIWFHKLVPYLCSKFGALNPKNKENRYPEILWNSVVLQANLNFSVFSQGWAVFSSLIVLYLLKKHHGQRGTCHKTLPTT